MSLKIVESSNYFMNIENYNSGARFTIYKKWYRNDIEKL